MKKIDLTGYVTRLKARAKPSDFPSEAHELAWKIALYFNEDYSFWVRKMLTTYRLVGQVKIEFEYIQGRSDWGMRQKVRMLMHFMFP